MQTLHELAQIPQNRTDKQNPDHSFAGENYLHIYERYFEPVRLQVRRVLEIGVCIGVSLRLWRDYFPNAQIVGIDIDPERAVHAGPRIAVEIGDQSDLAFLGRVESAYGPFDVVIDDGSHVTQHMIASLDFLLPKVAPKGIYAIEDLSISYGHPRADWPGMACNTSSIENAPREVFEQRLLSIVHDLDSRLGQIRSLHFHPMVAVIQKV